LKRIRQWFLGGLVVTLPTVITIWVLWKLFTSLDTMLQPLVERFLGFQIPGLGFITVIIIITLAGFLAGNFIGRLFMKSLELVAARLPLGGRIYLAVKQILDVLVSDSTETFRSVVTFEYPRPGIWALGFLSRETPPELLGPDGPETYNVFLPTSPNPTSGYLLIIARSEIHHTNLTVEEALKIILSGGAYMPSDLMISKTDDGEGG
jgi:uncharacterized membrane protein